MFFSRLLKRNANQPSFWQNATQQNDLKFSSFASLCEAVDERVKDKAQAEQCAGQIYAFAIKTYKAEQAGSQLPEITLSHLPSATQNFIRTLRDVPVNQNDIALNDLFTWILADVSDAEVKFGIQLAVVNYLVERWQL